MSIFDLPEDRERSAREGRQVEKALKHYLIVHK
jgi:hypothetical protein